MKKILTILLVISFFVNSIPISQFGKLVAFENTDNQTKEILSETTEGSNEIEYEITSLRGPNYKAFKTKDGMIEYNYYDENIHYLNESGEYIEYDVTLSETNNSYSNIVNNYEVILPKNLKKDNIILKYQDDILKIKYLSNSNKKEQSSKKENKKDDLRTLTKQASKVEYKNVLKHTTIELIHTPKGLKENLILDKYIENYSFSYILETNLELVYENETLYLYNEVEEEIFRFNPYNIIDNLGNIYYDVNLNIIKIDNGYQIEVIPNDELLQELEYPVIIDPVITYSGAETRNFIRAKYIKKDFLGSTEGIKLEKYIRYYEDSYGNVLSEDISTYTVMEINRSLLNQEYDLSALKYGKLSLKILSTTYENAYEIGVSEITRFRLNNVITPFYDYEDIDGFTVYNKEHIGTLKRKNNIYEMDISDLLREKYKEKILLELSPDKLGENENNVIFFGPNYSDLTKTPIMTLGFLDNKGLVNYLTYHTVSTDNTTAYINDCFGNLVIEQTDYISNSNKTSFNIKHYYNPNGFLQNLGYGYGFRISYLEQLITDNLFDQEYYYIFDSTGRKKYYIKGETTQLGTKYISEEGEDEYLLINDTVSKKIVEERYHYTYDNEGYLTNIVDIKYPDIYINITYNSVSDKKIKEITDSTGNIAKFLYTNSLLSSIEIYKKAFDNSGNKLANEVKVQTISYQYNSGDHLENIIYQVSNKIVKKESFEYNGMFITNATSYDVNSNNEEKLKSTISFEMDYLKVIKYTQQIGSNSLDEKNIEMNISYSNRTTTFTNNLGVTTKYLFDYFGHTQTIIDNFGNTVFYKYANYNGELYKDNPNYIIKHQLIEVSEPINNGYNLIDNHSFENGTTNWDIHSGIIEHISAYGKKALKSYQEIYQEKTLIARQKITIEAEKNIKSKH